MKLTNNILHFFKFSSGRVTIFNNFPIFYYYNKLSGIAITLISYHKMLKTIAIKIIIPDSVHLCRDPYSNDAILKFKMATLINKDFFVARHKIYYNTLKRSSVQNFMLVSPFAWLLSQEAPLIMIKYNICFENYINRIELVESNPHEELKFSKYTNLLMQFLPHLSF